MFEFLMTIALASVILYSASFIVYYKDFKKIIRKISIILGTLFLISTVSYDIYCHVDTKTHKIETIEKENYSISINYKHYSFENPYYDVTILNKENKAISFSSFNKEELEKGIEKEEEWINNFYEF
ncbi:hypothetical protein DVV91_16940 [Clostridium botulinum]|uniref:hypothetical protein n=1 Tax=Clostridium botulinum TaxID=1491 RepID=UPI0019687500|nr:hypothetical protein [Clostridium botulinum]MBN1076009.1 hypothetical protein [Clostridium botulinum]